MVSRATVETEIALAWARLVRASADHRTALLDELIPHADTHAEFFATLVASALESGDVAERCAAVRLAGAMPGGRGWLDAVHADPAVEVRAALLDADPSATTIQRALHDPEPEVRALACVRALSLPDPVPALFDRLTDPHREVTAAAIEALLRCPAGEVLDRVLASDLDRVTLLLLRRLAEVTPAEVLDRLNGLSEDMRDALLSEVLTHQIRRELGVRLTRLEPAERLRALSDLGVIGPDGLDDRIAITLRDPDPRVRAAAAGLIGAHHLTAATEHLKETFAGDPDLQVVEAAGRALRLVLEGSPTLSTDSTQAPSMPKEDL